MRRPAAALVLLAGALALPAPQARAAPPAQAAPAAEVPPAEFKVPDVRREVLANGLTVLVAPRHDAPVFSAVIAFRVGSVDEATGATGLAHMFEHMAFKGTRRIGTRDAAAEARLLGEIDRLVDRREALGPDDAARAADLDARILDLRARAQALVVPNAFTNLYVRNGAVGLNATTSVDLTSYYVRLPANRLPLWAAMEYARLTEPVLREFYTERDVVLEERSLRVDGNPKGRLLEAFYAAGFVAHPYRRPPLGWPSDVARLTRPDARRFFEAHYVPANMVIALAGDLDPDEALGLVRRTFGRLPARPPAPRPATAEPMPTGERHVVVYSDAEPMLLIGFLRPSGDHPDDAAIEVIHNVLAGSRAARLHRSLVLEQGLVTAIGTTDGPGSASPSLLFVSAVPRHPHTAPEVEAAVLDQLARLTREPISAEEQARAVTFVEAAIIRTANGNSGLADMLARYEALMGDWRYPFRLAGRMAALTPEEIRAVAARYLVPERRVVAELRRPPAEGPEVAP